MTCGRGRSRVLCGMTMNVLALEPAQPVQGCCRQSGQRCRGMLRQQLAGDGLGEGEAAGVANDHAFPDACQRPDSTIQRT